MKTEDLLDAIGNIRDDYIAAASKRKVWKKVYTRYLLIAAGICLVFGIGFRVRNIMRKSDLSSWSEIHLAGVDVLGQPHYPQGELADGAAGVVFSESYRNALLDFSGKTIPAVFADTGGENRIFSPVNLYMSLAVLEQMVTGEAEQKLLDLMGERNDSIVVDTKQLWEQLYCNQSKTQRLLANSIWVNEEDEVKEGLLHQIADHYYASVFHVKMGVERTEKAAAKWIDIHTGGLLTEDTEKISLPKETLLAVFSTLYFKDAWKEVFEEKDTKTGIFTKADGTAAEGDFMYGVRDSSYTLEESYVAASMDMEESKITFILPRKGIKPETVLADPNLLNDTVVHPESYGGVAFTVPKFDIKSSMSLKESMQQMGLGILFTESADFSPLTDDLCYLEKIQQSVRVAADEEGMIAASYTEEELWESSGPMIEMKLVLDRPFIFVISSDAGGCEVPLFVGVVNDPFEE